MQTIRDYIFVEEVPLDEKVQESSTGKLRIKKDTTVYQHKTGIVLSAGPGRYLESGDLETVNLKVGDKVLFPNFAGIAVPGEDQSKNYFVIRWNEVLAIV